MLNGTPIQFYYAICIYRQLASLEATRSSGFGKYYLNKYSFAADFNPVVTKAVKYRKKELLTTKIKNIGLIDNMYEWCKIISNFVAYKGFLPFVQD